MKLKRGMYMKKILVAYASKSGSTKEVAEVIGEVLTADNTEIYVRNIDSIANVIDYDCIVIGAPINGMRWMQDAVDFVGIHQSDLMYKPTAFFSLSYTVMLGRKMWKNQIVKAFNIVSKQVPPVATATFGGKVDGELPGVMRFVFGVPKNTPGDQRDWAMIRDWATSVGTEFLKNDQK